MPLRFKNKKVLIYVYRPSRLLPDVQGKEADELLSQRGSCTQNCGRCLARWMKRLGESDEFPHEIGLFLGYPVEDVKGFIENKASYAKCVGCWKVYGDEKKAIRLFKQYRKCTCVYKKQWYAGKPLTKLAVAS